MEWTSSVVQKLISEYKERPVLWNSNLPDYSDKILRERGLVEISSILDTDVESVKKKINGLRTQFLAEQKKVMDCQTSGAGYDEVYIPKWAYYKELLFLRDCTVPRNSKSNLKNGNKEKRALAHEGDSTDEDPELSLNLSRQEQSGQAPKRRKVPPENELMAAATAALSNYTRKDDLETFGAYVAAELRTLSPPSRTIAKSRLFETLMEFKRK